MSVQICEPVFPHELISSFHQNSSSAYKNDSVLNETFLDTNQSLNVKKSLKVIHYRLRARKLCCLFRAKSELRAGRPGEGGVLSGAGARSAVEPRK